VFSVLIVDDCSVLRDALKAFLTSQFPSILVGEAVNGEEALSAFQKLNPFLIFMDINLPDKSGLELTRIIKALNPQTEIVILTNHESPEYREAAFQSGASHFLTKRSIKIEEVISLVASALKTRAREGRAGRRVETRLLMSELEYSNMPSAPHLP